MVFEPASVHPVPARRRSLGHAAALLLAILLPALALSGCGRDRRALPPCPEVRILAVTSEMTQFRPGPGRDITDVEYDVSAEGVSGECTYRNGNSLVEVDLTAAFIVERGPALQGNVVRFPYYVAIVTRDEQILAKEVFWSEVRFEPGQRRVGLTETSRERIPLADGRFGSDYEILVGLQLDGEQLRFNRQERGF